MAIITTAEASEKLGVHRTRIQALIKAGRLPAQLIGGMYIIEEKDLALVAVRKPGRPPSNGSKTMRTKSPRKAKTKKPKAASEGKSESGNKEDRVKGKKP